uniref:F-box protein n=1 Tax=Ascaris lumbricoides TaxID=6252 RepID=A0A0M3IUX0_ASCLU
MSIIIISISSPKLILACPSSLFRFHRQRLVTCLTISYTQEEDLFQLATFKKSHSSRKNSLTISRQDVLNQRGQNLRFCFRRFRILGLQFSNVPLCSRSVNYFCDMLISCRALEPKTLRICDCYVADLNGTDLQRLMKLCGSHLIVLSFMVCLNLAGVHSSLLHDDLFTTTDHTGLYVLMIQSIDFHFSVPLCDQFLRIGDATLAMLPITMRKVKLEKCGHITA